MNSLILMNETGALRAPVFCVFLCFWGGEIRKTGQKDKLFRMSGRGRSLSIEVKYGKSGIISLNHVLQCRRRVASL